MTDERFPIQEGPSVPWEFMAPHESQCWKNHHQSLKRIAERGGLGPSEAWAVVNGIRYYEIKDEHTQKWFELAERVNREWSTNQSQAEVLASAIKAVGHLKNATVASMAGHPDRTTSEQCVHYCPACKLEKLQPAAEALNEILKQVQAKMLARLKMARAAMAQAMDALESDTELDERRKAFEVLQEQFEGVGDNNEAVSEKQAAEALEEYIKNLPLSEIARIKGIPGIAKLGKIYDRPDFTCAEE